MIGLPMVGKIPLASNIDSGPVSFDAGPGRMGNSPLAQPSLEVFNIRKTYGATVALAGASLALYPGEVHVLLGENGAGKSTLGKIVAGLEKPDSGEVRLNGQPVDRPFNRKAAGEAGIAIVLQELSIIPLLSVAENLFLGQEKGSLLDQRNEKRRALSILKEYGLACHPDQPAGELSAAERQLLEIAKVAARRPQIVIMDEPSSRLTNREKVALYTSVRKLREDGASIVYVTHHLNEVLEIADRVSAMRDGVIVQSQDVDDSLTEDDLVKMLTGRAVQMPVRRPVPPSAKEVIGAKDICIEGATENIDLNVRAGEIVALYGVVGCGREKLVAAMIGKTAVTRGQFTFHGQAHRPTSVRSTIRSGIGYLPNDRKEQGILAERSLLENLNLASLVHAGIGGMVDLRKERDRTLQRMRELTVKFASVDQPISSLSGGNQQKILFGRVAETTPALLILEEPTAGIDIGAKSELYMLCQKLTEAGVAILLVSSDLRETIAISHRIYTMFNGRIVSQLQDPTTDDEARILADVLGSTTYMESNR